MTANSNPPFHYLIAIHPLGLLYGSAGPFLSPENLVGRAGNSFPPSAATLSGIFAAHYGNDKVQDLQLAGPFWSQTDTLDSNNDDQDFFVPTPFIYLVEKGEATIAQTLSWQPQVDNPEQWGWRNQNGELPIGKFDSQTWLSLRQWDNPQSIQRAPWKFLPHLHPRLELDQRRVAAPRRDVPDDEPNTQGSLFLENAVQLPSDVCLVYLSNQALQDGWYRFGGEGHIVEVTCHELGKFVSDRLVPPSLGCAFALITPGVWGSNRFSLRYPDVWRSELYHDAQTGQESILTGKPIPCRYRMGGKGAVKRLSRGRYAVPAGTVYVMRGPQPPWHQWTSHWTTDLFPKEGPHLNRWGCGLALPLPATLSLQAQAA
ncbi:hypothetical protein BST81_18815 [Leptolyngbya sp. 'hensonii']|uniref:type III-B CRISPR module-associated Cmr3 family protein n=1 Tax=Leptolyngbya sp. 'hensonii' TaxID=1922337 RepID=UPI00094F7FAF|nr:type III-B CRISPR module-associated Cmr3 family protein [Leptolyngbya sp. 'hensonii']OLP16753.1 hypothetical protein BST81_18815 [Leptolyngbya sp. 'hensonii']